MRAWFSSSSTRRGSSAARRHAGVVFAPGSRSAAPWSSRRRTATSSGVSRTRASSEQNRVLVERARAVRAAVSHDVALAGAQRNLERRPALGVVLVLHVEIELVRLDADVVDGQVDVAVGDRKAVERQMQRSGRLLLRLRQLDGEIPELAVRENDARMGRLDVDLLDEQLAAHQGEKARVHRGLARRERRTAAVGRVDAHVRELERERPQMRHDVETRHDPLLAERLGGLAHRPLARVGRANEADRRERKDARERQNERQRAREGAPDAWTSAPPARGRREAGRGCKRNARHGPERWTEAPEKA